MKCWPLVALLFLCLSLGCGSAGNANQPTPASNDAAAQAAARKKSEAFRQAAKMDPQTISQLATPWTPEADREQHLRYHWPLDFKLPVDIQLPTPPVPPEVARPSPPLANKPK